MKRTRYFLSALLVMVMVFTAACGGNTAGSSSVSGSTGSGSSTAAAGESEDGGKEIYVIGCSWMDLTTQYQATLKSYVEKYYRDHYDGQIQLIHMDGQSNSANQVSQMETLVSQNVDAILMVPYDRAGCAPGVKAAAEAGIPVIELCQETDSGMRTSFVGSDHKVSGVQTMSALAEAADGTGKMVVLEGPTGQDCVIARSEGMQEVLAKNPDIQIIATKTCDWDRAAAMTAVENIIQSGMEFDIIFAQSDSMAMGALEALKGTEFESRVLVGGIDCIPDALAAVSEGRLVATSFQNAPEQAKIGLEVALQAAKGETVDSLYDIPFELVDSINCNEPKYAVDLAE